jgi:hypothetical protein
MSRDAPDRLTRSLYRHPAYGTEFSGDLIEFLGDCYSVRAAREPRGGPFELSVNCLN